MLQLSYNVISMMHSLHNYWLHIFMGATGYHDAGSHRQEVVNS